MRYKSVKSSHFKIKLPYLILIIISLGIGITVGAANSSLLMQLQLMVHAPKVPAPTTIPAQGTIEVAFSPQNGATRTVVKAINEANSTILIAAYTFTARDIAAALLAAKRRGIQVKLLLDHSQATNRYSSSTFFTNQHFDVRIDTKHAIFHDKVMIIDSKTIITGSFNFTKAAETKNAENLLVLRNNPPLAQLYMQDWWYNWYQALPHTEFLLRHPPITDINE